ncbi:unnamed protein product [Onchocerca flexuosa]|uniref:SRCR domain-containing protein n=1 Tax=Onchocerca flexuosa TaxID=387005 RepID=A0A183I1U5_9BILA|nr:unnamed protein product [Onchocerca flexuosa]
MPTPGRCQDMGLWDVIRVEERWSRVGFDEWFDVGAVVGCGIQGRREGRPRFESGSREEDNNCPEQGTASGRRGDNCPNP